MTYELIKSHRLHAVSKGLIDDLSTSAERGLACTAASPLAPALASQLRYGDEAVFSRRAESDGMSRVLFRRRDNRCDLRCILATPPFSLHVVIRVPTVHKPWSLLFPFLMLPFLHTPMSHFPHSHIQAGSHSVRTSPPCAPPSPTPGRSVWGAAMLPWA